MRLDAKNALLGERELETLLKLKGKQLEGCLTDGRLAMKGWLDLSLPMGEVSVIEKTAREIARDFDSFVVCGIGGSALGTRAVHTALNGVYYNERKNRKTPKLYIEDNIDPSRVKELLEVVDLKKTVFNFISKSGGTMETLAQLLIVAGRLREAGLPLSKHLIVTVGEEGCGLYKFAEKENIKIFRIPALVGGRFSVFTPAALLPLAVTGVDIRALLTGAREYKDNAVKNGLEKNPSALFAAANYLSAASGKKIVVLMPYVSSFKYISDWFCQLWAESLGKKYDLDGKVVNCGQTPVSALGTTDQHSLLQLLMEGPDDKVTVFIETEKYAADLVTGRAEGAHTELLAHRRFADLQNAALSGVRRALAEAGRASLTVTLGEINAEQTGSLLMFFMLATAYAGALLNINPYDQPGVEAGKIIAKEILQETAVVI